MKSVVGRVHGLLVLIAAASAAYAQGPSYSFDEAQSFLGQYCKGCHSGAASAGGFHLKQVADAASLRSSASRWSGLTTRVRNGEMPPKGAPAPSVDAREHFAGWVDQALRAEACSAGIQPGPKMIRRLNRDEYSATIRDLLDLHMDIGSGLPADGAGGEGFDNAAETLFLSPLHAEKYMDLARFALEYAAREHKSRKHILRWEPGAQLSASEAARRNLTSFLSRAFRRPASATDIEPYLAMFEAARKNGQAFESAMLLAMRGALVSPRFLFRTEPPNHSGKARPIDDYALASRLSYFLWGSMPDELLFDAAAAGKLSDPEVLQQMVRRMLRNDRSMDFSRRFVEQWLRTRELGGDKQPDPEMFPAYAADEELRADIRYQPFLFFREILLRDLPVTNLIDSKHTIGTSNLAKHYGIDLPVNRNNRKQPQWVELPEGSNRGGLLGMAAVLAVSSYPYRTSPVLRGAWVLDSILGTPPPPPPPDVPALEEAKAGAPPKSVRERLEQHRSNAVCASCHNRIDGIGFALENYDPIGRWRDADAGKPLDVSGKLSDGTNVHGPAELKAVLLDRKDVFVRNLTNKLLGYALGRGLTLEDSCTVDEIVQYVKNNDYRAMALIDAIVTSVPFRYAPPENRQLTGVRKP